MKITLYNTCPDEFEKKLKKIRKDLLPEQKAGKIITELVTPLSDSVKNNG